MLKKVFFGSFFLLSSFMSINAEASKVEEKQSNQNKLGCIFGSCNTCSCYNYNGKLKKQKTHTGWCNDSGKCMSFCGTDLYAGCSD